MGRNGNYCCLRLTVNGLGKRYYERKNFIKGKLNLFGIDLNVYNVDRGSNNETK